MPTLTHDKECELALDKLIEHAFNIRASDIHIEPHNLEWKIRFRVDGLLHYWTDLPFAPSLIPRMVARIKVLAALDIGESRLPQDGQWRPTHIELDIRVSTLALHHGEKVVLRLFNAATKTLSLIDLGLETAQLNHVRNFEHIKEGIVLVVGPTGSGKTTTLYALIDFLNKSEINIVSAEDPIERPIDNINQVEINNAAGRTFAIVLRAFLRQDPDTILIGEIRDEESAQIALRAAQTGHLVLASVHANSIEGTYRRLSHLGIDEFEAETTVRAIINQRLVRLKCTECAKRDARCGGCIDGYSGRQAIYEMGTLNEAIKPTMREVAQSLIQSGKTDEQEVMRAIGI